MSEAAVAGDAGPEGPEVLLRGVLAALRLGADAGAEALFAALTARARGPLGGEAGLRRALANELLAPLVAHARVDVAPWDRRGAAARTTVAVAGPNGTARYLIAARHDDAGWRLSGLQRDDLPPA